MTLSPGTYSIDVPQASDAAFTTWKASRKGNVGVVQATAGLDGAPNHYVFSVKASTEWGPWPSTVSIPNPTSGFVDASVVQPTTAPAYPAPASPVDTITNSIATAAEGGKALATVAAVGTIAWLGWELWKAARE